MNTPNHHRAIPILALLFSVTLGFLVENIRAGDAAPPPHPRKANDAAGPRAEIEISAGQVNVIGNEVDSNKKVAGATDYWRHFVTPKEAGGTLKLKGKMTRNPANQNFTDVFKWAVFKDGTKTEYTTEEISISRADEKKIEVYIVYKDQNKYEFVNKMAVWVVWAIITPSKIGTVNSGTSTRQPPHPAAGVIYRYPKYDGYRFEAEIKPSEICTWTDDVPNLKGSSTGGNTGAPLKWDMSRRMRRRLDNGAQTTKTDYWGTSNFENALPANPIPATALLYNYPADDVTGNDDAGSSDEDNDPYSNQNEITSEINFRSRLATPGNTIKSPIGRIASFDAPSAPFLRNDMGANGNIFVIRNQFQEFSRLQIKDKWYRISNFCDWQFLVKFSRGTNSLNDSGSGIITNNDGW